MPPVEVRLPHGSSTTVFKTDRTVGVAFDPANPSDESLRFISRDGAAWKRGPGIIYLPDDEDGRFWAGMIDGVRVNPQIMGSTDDGSLYDSGGRLWKITTPASRHPGDVKAWLEYVGIDPSLATPDRAGLKRQSNAPFDGYVICEDSREFIHVFTGEQDVYGWHLDRAGVGWEPQKGTGKYKLDGQVVVRLPDDEWTWVGIVSASETTAGLPVLISADGQQYLIAHDEPRHPDGNYLTLVPLSDSEGK